MTKILTELYVN